MTIQEKNNPRAAQTQQDPQGRKALPSAAPAAQKKWGKKELLLLLALVFFLFSVIFIVPAGRIPLVRNLAWMMGFSSQDTQSMSFGRALWTWVGDENRHFGSAEEISLFDSSRQADVRRGGKPQTGLFDLAALNASLRAQGKRPDGLYGAYYGTEEEDGAALRRKVDGWSSQAQQQARALIDGQEVYFGEDATLAARENLSDVKGSKDTVGLLPKAPIVGSVRTDWLGQAVDKAALLSNAQVDGALHEATQTNNPLTTLSQNLTAGQRPQRDLAHVWLMSSAANRAKQLMLKKQLAAAGYMAMEMPKKVYDSSGMGSGLQLRGDEVMSDLGSANEQLLREEECRKIASGAGQVTNRAFTESQTRIRSLVGGFPKSCSEAGALVSWKENLSVVKTSCQEVKQAYDSMSSFCGLALKEKGSCETVRLDNYVEEFTKICGDETLTDEQKQEQMDVLTGDVDKDVKDSFNIPIGNSEEVGSNPFFPEGQMSNNHLL